MSNPNRLVAAILAPLVSLTLLGCASTAGGAAGAGVAVQVTERGASSLVNASLDRASGWTRDAFAALNIRMKEVEQKRDARTFKGAAGDLDVTAELDRTQTGTLIEITVRRSAATWDRDFAQRVLARIVRRT